MSAAWVTMASFFTPPTPQPEFEAVVADEVDRFARAAREAGLDPGEHVRVSRGEAEVCVEISPALNALFTPEQTLWRAQ